MRIISIKSHLTLISMSSVYSDAQWTTRIHTFKIFNQSMKQMEIEFTNSSKIDLFMHL